jgi:threonylcarbamoyladenosine tRNA methylthiotransferase MtaB
MQAAAAPSARAFLEGMLGKTVPVLFETPVEGRPGWIRGYAPNYVDVMADVQVDVKGKIIPVRLTEVFEDILIGEIE